MTKTKVLLTPVLAIAAVAAILVIGRGGTQPAAAEQSAAPQPVAASSAYGVFGAPASTAFTAAESAGRDRAVAGVPPRAAVDPRLTRMVRSDATSRIYAMAGATAVCLHVEEPVNAGIAPGWGSTSCGSLADSKIRDRPMTCTTLLNGGRWQLSALVPDGVRSVKVETSTGDVIDLEVVENAVSRTFDAEPTRVTWTLADGTADSLDPWSNQ